MKKAIALFLVAAVTACKAPVTSVDTAISSRLNTYEIQGSSAEFCHTLPFNIMDMSIANIVSQVQYGKDSFAFSSLESV